MLLSIIKLEFLQARRVAFARQKDTHYRFLEVVHCLDVQLKYCWSFIQPCYLFYKVHVKFSTFSEEMISIVILAVSVLPVLIGEYYSIRIRSQILSVEYLQTLT